MVVKYHKRCNLSSLDINWFSNIIKVYLWNKKEIEAWLSNFLSYNWSWYQSYIDIYNCCMLAKQILNLFMCMQVA